jgi:hypothetical protein
MSYRSAILIAALALVVSNGCGRTGGLAPVEREGGGGGAFVTPSPGANMGGSLASSPEPAGVPVTLPPVTAPPPLVASPSPAAGGGGGGGVGASPGTSPAPFPAISPPPSPALGAVGGP